MNNKDGALPSGRAFAASPSSPAVSTVSASIPSAGDKFTIIYPFVRDTYQAFDVEGVAEVATWKPGIRFENVGPEDVGSVADAIGKCTFTVVDVFKPGRFPTRVFFTRFYENPDGHMFGKRNLHIATLDKFRRLARGYQHKFGIGEPLVEHRWNVASAQDEFETILRDWVAAQAIEARSGETGTGSIRQDESAVPAGDAPNTDDKQPGDEK